MKATHADPRCCHHPVKPERGRPQRGEAYWYLSKRLFNMHRVQGDDAGMDEGRWRVGNVFLRLEHAEHARTTITELVRTVHQDHASPGMASP
jgi:hypothetical protein